MTNLPPSQPGQEAHRRVTAYACLDEGLAAMLRFFNVDVELAHPMGSRGPAVWILTGNPWELGALPLDYTEEQAEAFAEGYALCLQRARAHGVTPDPPPSPDTPIGRPYQPEED